MKEIEAKLNELAAVLDSKKCSYVICVSDIPDPETADLHGLSRISYDSGRSPLLAAELCTQIGQCPEFTDLAHMTGLFLDMPGGGQHVTDLIEVQDLDSKC